MILEPEKISPFKETLILYTLTGATILIGISWTTMFIKLIRDYQLKNNTH